MGPAASPCAGPRSCGPKAPARRRRDSPRHARVSGEVRGGPRCRLPFPAGRGGGWPVPRRPVSRLGSALPLPALRLSRAELPGACVRPGPPRQLRAASPRLEGPGGRAVLSGHAVCGPAGEQAGRRGAWEVLLLFGQHFRAGLLLLARKCCSRAGSYAFKLQFQSCALWVSGYGNT